MSTIQHAAMATAAERLVSGVDLVASGLTAAVLHGLPVLGRPPAAAEVCERRDERPRHHGRSTTLRPEETVELMGVPTTSLARTVVDLPRKHGRVAGVLAADAALARGLAREELHAVLAGCTGWPGAASAAWVVSFADGRAESPLESLGRLRLHEQGLPEADLQVPFFDEDGLIGRVDHHWAQHRTVGEADGALKYTARAALFEEKQREDRLRDTGLEVFRYTWEEAFRRPALVAARARRAFARAASRRAAG